MKPLITTSLLLICFLTSGQCHKWDSIAKLAGERVYPCANPYPVYPHEPMFPIKCGYVVIQDISVEGIVIIYTWAGPYSKGVHRPYSGNVLVKIDTFYKNTPPTNTNIMETKPIKTPEEILKRQPCEYNDYRDKIYTSRNVLKAIREYHEQFEGETAGIDWDGLRKKFIREYETDALFHWDKLDELFDWFKANIGGGK